MACISAIVTEASVKATSVSHRVQNRGCLRMEGAASVVSPISNKLAFFQSVGTVHVALPVWRKVSVELVPSVTEIEAQVLSVFQYFTVKTVPPVVLLFPIVTRTPRNWVW